MNPAKAVELEMPKKSNSKIKSILKYKAYYFMLLLPLSFIILFKYVPMYGIIIAFKDFHGGGLEGIINSPWVGFDNFMQLFESRKFFEVLKNTLVISGLKLLFGFPMPIVFALLLNELRVPGFKKFVQTSSYLPHFISWVIAGGIVINFLSPNTGLVNTVIKLFGGDPVYFMISKDYFRPILVISAIWKETGWAAILYIASLSKVDSSLYEAAVVDGASRFKQLLHITLPSIKGVIFIMLILNIGKLLEADFDQVFALINSRVYKVGDILDTYVYRLGVLEMNYSFSTAVGLFKSVVCAILIFSSNFISRKLGEDGIF